MRPRKKGQQYEICYRCPGYTKPIYERFPTYEAANLRIAQIEYEKSIGEFRPPKQTPIQTKRAQKKFITVSELLDEYVQVYGLNHWGDSFLSCNLHRIEHYIKPYLGNVAVKDLTTHDLDLFYDSLQDKPAVVLKGHKKTDACVSRSVIEKTHALLRSALNQAVIWEYIPSNPDKVKVLIATGQQFLYLLLPPFFFRQCQCYGFRQEHLSYTALRFRGFQHQRCVW